MEHRVRLLNVSDQVISHRYGGKLWSFAPHGHKGSLIGVPPDVADELVLKFGHDLQEVGNISKRSYVPVNDIKRYYVGNFSGDPDAPKEFDTTKITREGKEVQVKVKNSLSSPRTYVRALGRVMEIKPPGSVEYVDPYLGRKFNDFPMQVTLPGKPVIIPPYSVVEVTYQQFYSIMLSERGNRAFFCRPSRDLPWVPEFTDQSMTLDKLNVYLSMFGETPSQEAGAALVVGSEAKIRSDMAASGAEEDAIEETLESLRWDTWARGRLRAMNLDHPLPTKDEFLAAWEAYEAQNGEGKAAKRGRKAKLTDAVSVNVTGAEAGSNVPSEEVL